MTAAVASGTGAIAGVVDSHASLSVAVVVVAKSYDVVDETRVR